MSTFAISTPDAARTDTAESLLAEILREMSGGDVTVTEKPLNSVTIFAVECAAREYGRIIGKNHQNYDAVLLLLRLMTVGTNVELVVDEPLGPRSVPEPFRPGTSFDWERYGDLFSRTLQRTVGSDRIKKIGGVKIARTAVAFQVNLDWSNPPAIDGAGVSSAAYLLALERVFKAVGNCAGMKITIDATFERNQP